MAKDEMVGQHPQFNGHELGQAPGDRDREVWRATVHGVAELHMTWQLNNINTHTYTVSNNKNSTYSLWSLAVYQCVGAATSVVSDSLRPHGL